MAKVVRKALVDGIIVNSKVDAAAAIVESKLSLDYSTSGLNSAISTVSGNLATHVGLTNNPHSVTKTQVGLANVTNDAQLKASDLDVDGTLAANSDTKIPSQKAVKTYADTKIALTEKGANLGVATLDAGGKIPASQLPNSVMEFKGVFNPATATFTDAAGNAGDVYLASVAGSYDAGAGSITYAIGDWAVHNGTAFEKSLNSNAVVTVNGQAGVVVLDADDISDAATTNKFATSAEKTKLGFITVTQAVDLDTVESDLSGHIANTSNPHSVTKTQVGLANVTNDAQLKAADLDIDGTLAANSDSKIPSQKAVKTYADTKEPANANIQSHISSTSNPHSVTKTQVGLSNVDNVQQLPMSYLDIDGTLAANSDVKVPSQKAVKSYVASQLATMHVPATDRIVLSAGDITNQYVDLSFAAISAASISVAPKGWIDQDPNSDYTVSLTGGVAGVTRILFTALGDLAVDMVAGDVLFVKYSK